MSDVRPYDFERKFEAFVVAHACQSPKFWGRVKDSIEIEAMKLEASRDALSAVRDITKERGNGPNSSVMVLQRLRQWMIEGSINLDRIHAVAELLEDADDFGLPRDEDVLAELVPVLKGREVQAAAMDVATESAKPPSQVDFDAVIRRLTGVQRLGERDGSIGHKIGVASLDRIRSLSHLDRLPLGVPELDLALDGGVGYGLTCFIMGTGVGKSMTKCHISAHALMSTLHVGYATLELPSEEIEARIVANMTGIPINALMSGAADQLAEQRMRAMEPFMGALVVKDFTPKATTVEDIIDWVEECEDEAGVPMHVVVVDMLPKLKGPATTGKGDFNTYHQVGWIFEHFRNYCKDRRKWGITSMQPQRGAKDKKKIDTDDAADSMEGPRVCDCVITGMRTDDESQHEFFIAKARHSEGRKTVGPLPHDYRLGRVVPFARRVGNDVW